MDKFLGLIDALEALVMDSKRIPLTSKVILEEHRLFDLTSKMRDLIKNKGNILPKSVMTDTEPVPQLESEEVSFALNTQKGWVKSKETQDLMQSAYEQMESMKAGSKKYADDVLANLQLVITKMQTDILRMKNTIENGRQYIENKDKEKNNAPMDIKQDKMGKSQGTAIT
ncbi:MAG: hypothetical protein VW378_07355 [bacterium]